MVSVDIELLQVSLFGSIEELHAVIRDSIPLLFEFPGVGGRRIAATSLSDLAELGEWESHIIIPGLFNEVDNLRDLIHHGILPLIRLLIDPDPRVRSNTLTSLSRLASHSK